MALTAQSLTFNRGEALSLPFSVLAAQYPNATEFNWKFQIVDTDGTVALEKTGTATVASLSFAVALTSADTLTLEEQAYPYWSLWDTTNKRLMAFGSAYVGPAQL